MESDDKITLQMLPIEMVQLILTKINSCDARNNGRLVCREWNYMINKYAFNDPFIIEQRDDNARPVFFPFTELISTFLGFQRTNMALKFYCVDLDNSDTFWIRRGSNIESLHFELCDYSLDTLRKMVEHCVNLKSLHLGPMPNIEFKSPERIARLKSEGVVHKRLTSIYVNVQYFYDTVEELMDETKICVNKIIQIFPNVKRIQLCLLRPFVLKDYVDRLEADFIELKRKIVISSQLFNQEVVFNYSDSIPVSMTKTVMGLESYEDVHDFLVKNPLLEELMLYGTWGADKMLLSVYETNFQIFKLKKLTLLFEIPFRPRYCNSFKVNDFTSSFVKSFSNLTSLDVYAVTYDVFKLFCDYLPHLEELIIKNCMTDSDFVPHSEDNISKLKKLKFLDIPPNFIVMENQISLEKLQRLSIFFSSCACHRKIIKKKPAFNFDFDQFYFPKLEQLKLDNFGIFNMNTFSSERKKENRMKVFTTQLELILPAFPTLQSIEFLNCQYDREKPTDEDMEPIFQKYKTNGLKKINLNDWKYESPYLKK